MSHAIGHIKNMNHFQPNDKVVCINDTQDLVYRAPGSYKSFDEFSLPNGFVEKGAVYCVLAVKKRPGKPDGLALLGKPIRFRGGPGYWVDLRFRKVNRDAKRKIMRSGKSGLMEIKRTKITPHPMNVPYCHAK